MATLAGQAIAKLFSLRLVSTRAPSPPFQKGMCGGRVEHDRVTVSRLDDPVFISRFGPLNMFRKTRVAD